METLSFETDLKGQPLEPTEEDRQASTLRAIARRGEEAERRLAAAEQADDDLHQLARAPGRGRSVRLRRPDRTRSPATPTRTLGSQPRPIVSKPSKARSAKPGPRSVVGPLPAHTRCEHYRKLEPPSAETEPPSAETETD